MTDAFLLGAGFSKAISDRMLLLRELGQSFPLQTYGLPPVELSENFEALLTYLAEDQPWLSEVENAYNRASFLEVSARVALVLQGAQAAAFQVACPEWFLKLVSLWIQNETWVVTLNYDVLVEKAFTELLRRQEPEREYVMSHWRLYPVQVASSLSLTSLVRGREEGPSFHLTKLHGSINWRWSGSLSFSGQTIYDVGLVPGWRNETSHPSARMLDKVPMVVPPTLGKSPYFSNETLRAMWRLAREAFRNAQDIYCIGYSLPESDHTVLTLLREIATRPGTTFHVINTSSEAGDRYRRLLGTSARVDISYVTGEDPVRTFAGSYGD